MNSHIPRILALLLVIAMIVLCILLAQPVRAAECRLEGKSEPEPEPWEPEPAEVTALAQCLYGECRGCSELQQRAVCWVVFNRVEDSRFPDSIIGVVSAPHQLQGYSPSNPVWENLYDVAHSCIVDWHNGDNRVLDPDMCWFSGWNHINHFRNAWRFEDATKFWEEE